MPPTFGVEPEVVTGIIAGGDHALRMSIEGAEDQASSGTRDLGAVCKPGDVVVGISASGRAPYVVAAVEKAKADFGAAGTIAFTCNAESPLARAADVPIVVEVGPEVIAGSSRTKAGTATKLVLNMLSTTSMVKLGRTRDDLMVDLRPTNEKLRQRAIGMVAREAGVSAEEAEHRLKTWGWHVRAAIEEAARGEPHATREAAVRSNPAVACRTPPAAGPAAAPRYSAFAGVGGGPSPTWRTNTTACAGAA